MSTSEKNPLEKPEKHRIWELEEQLDDEQHAHRKTKSALRYVQDKLEQMSNEGKNQRTMNSGDDKNLKEMYDNSSKMMIEDLRREVSRLMKSKNETVKSLEISKLENEDLRNRLIESNASFKSTILALEKKIGTVKTENKSLKTSSKIREAQLTVHLERADKSERLLQTKTEEVERLNRIVMNKSKEIGVQNEKTEDDLKNRQSYGNAPFKSIIIDLKTTIGTLENASIAENTSPEMNEVVPGNTEKAGSDNMSVARSRFRFWRVTKLLRNENKRLAKLLMAVMKNIEDVMKKTGSDAEEREQLNEAMQRLERHEKSKSLWLDSFALFEFSADACAIRVEECVQQEGSIERFARSLREREASF